MNPKLEKSEACLFSKLEIFFKKLFPNLDVSKVKKFSNLSASKAIMIPNLDTNLKSTEIKCRNVKEKVKVECFQIEDIFPFHFYLFDISLFYFSPCLCVVPTPFSLPLTYNGFPMPGAIPFFRIMKTPATSISPTSSFCLFKCFSSKNWVIWYAFIFQLIGLYRRANQ